jgi:alanine racemase
VSFGARALIRLGALRHNLKVIRKRAPGTRVMAVIKANAYGHGLIEVAKALAEADGLAVARLGEAEALRAAAIESPIVILQGVTDAADLDLAVSKDCGIVVYCVEQLELLEHLDSGRLGVWLKFDTGMNRLGFALPDAAAIISRARKCRAIRQLGVMSHLANADDRNDHKTIEQLRLFRPIAEGFDGDVSIANSPGLFGWPAAAEQGSKSGEIWIRPGIALYGISPFSESTGKDLGLRPVMQFESQLIAVKAIKAGERVGYGGVWQADQDSVIGVVSAGYGDGYPRSLPSGTPVLINERRVPLVGRVSMDMIVVELGPDSSDAIGDRAVLWGDGLPVEEIAEFAGTIPYQLVTGILNREPSVFVA